MKNMDIGSIQFALTQGAEKMMKKRHLRWFKVIGFQDTKHFEGATAYKWRETVFESHMIIASHTHVLVSRFPIFIESSHRE